MPRRYRLQARASQVDRTRARIIQAAVELSTERGSSATTMKDIGRRADVAPGTLRRHFPTRDALDAAVVERAMAEMPLPEPDIFEGATTIEARLARLLQATGTFMDQAAPWYRMWQREPMVHGPWAEAGARYGARWDELMRLALGPMAEDAEAAALLRAMLAPMFFDDLRTDGRTTAAVADLILDVVGPWFSAREAALLRED